MPSSHVPSPSIDSSGATAEPPAVVPRSILVTGSSSGVGAAAVKLLRENGWTVRGLSRTQGELAPEEWIPCDLADPAVRAVAWDALVASLGGIPEAVVLNAGAGYLAAIEDADDAMVRRLWELNYFSVVDLMRRILPSWRQARSGRAVLVGSVVSRLAFPFRSHYCASKAAIRQFALALRHEVRRFGIRAAVVEPGLVRSSFHHAMPREERRSEAYAAQLDEATRRDLVPERGGADPGEVARVVLSILEKRDPAPVWAVGRDAVWFRRLHPFLPETWIERLVRGRLNPEPGE